jgi:hypothetical protein
MKKIVFTFSLLASLLLPPLLSFSVFHKQLLSTLFTYPPRIATFPTFGLAYVIIFSIIFLLLVTFLVFPKALGFSNKNSQHLENWKGEDSCLRRNEETTYRNDEAVNNKNNARHSGILRSKISGISHLKKLLIPLLATLTLLFWFTSWTTLSALQNLRHLSFTFLWFSLIFLIDAWVYLRKGHSLLTRSIKTFLFVCFCSIVGWWYFEYTNLFILNWYYIGFNEISKTARAFYLSASFATYLPALLELTELFASFSWLNKRYSNGPTINIKPKIIFIIGLVCLFSVGACPMRCFSLLWVGALFVPLALCCHSHPQLSLSLPLSKGDYRAFAALAFAGVICGLLWEMWGFYSFPTWRENVAFVNFGHYFAMPFLGMSGFFIFSWVYLLLCICIAKVFNIKLTKLNI